MKAFPQPQGLLRWNAASEKILAEKTWQHFTDL
jgi:hypothetical protein